MGQRAIGDACERRMHRGSCTKHRQFTVAFDDTARDHSRNRASSALVNRTAHFGASVSG